MYKCMHYKDTRYEVKNQRVIAKRTSQIMFDNFGSITSAPAIYRLPCIICSTVAYCKFLSPQQFAEYFGEFVFHSQSSSSYPANGRNHKRYFSGSYTKFVLQIFHIGPTHENTYCRLTYN